MPLFGEVPTMRAYAVAFPAVQLKLTLEELKVDPGSGLTICTDPGLAVGVGLTVAVGVGVALGPGVGVGVGVGVGEPVGGPYKAWMPAISSAVSA